MTLSRGGFKFMKKRSKVETKDVQDNKKKKKSKARESKSKSMGVSKSKREKVIKENVDKLVKGKNVEEDTKKDNGNGEAVVVEVPPTQDTKHNPSHYPCCFDIPLDIAMEGLALFDIVYFSFVTIFWTIILALEPFAGRSFTIVRRNLTMGPQYLESFQRLFDFELSETTPLVLEFDYEDRFDETSTTIGPSPFDASDVDFEKMARNFSRISYMYSQHAQEVDENCGVNYFVDYLFSNELNVTRNLFEEVVFQITFASSLFVFLSALLMATICCFRGYIFSKIFVILLCYAQLFPTYLTMVGAFMSQSHRLCVLQYGLSKIIRGQTLMFCLLMWPVFILKPYQIFIWANYIYEYFNNKQGTLFDESYFSPTKVDERMKNAPLYTPIDQEHDDRALTRPHLFKPAKKIKLPDRRGKSKRLLWGGNTSKFRKELPKSHNSSSSD